MSSLDEIDWKILENLQENPNFSNVKLSERISSALNKSVHRNTINNRIKKLREKKILEYPTCALNPVKLGFQGVGVVCLKMEPLQVEKAAKILTNFAEVTCLGTTMGDFDVAFQVVTKDAKKLQHFINAHVRTLPGFVSAQISTFVEMYKNTHKINLEEHEH